MPTPVTTEFIGFRAALIDAADPPTAVTATKITGGGQAPSPAQASLVIQGVGAAATDYPTASRFVTLDYDRVTAGSTALNFSSGGTDEGKLLWVWANALLAPTSTGSTVGGSRGGLGIVVSDDATITNSWAIWTFYGSENYPGGWQKLVVDPTLRPTASGGTFAASSLSSIRKIGIFFVADNNAKGGADAALLDSIEVGSGLRIYGSGTFQDGFGDLLDADEGVDASGARYGVVKSLEATNNILQIQGYLEIGDDSGGTVFNDINKVITFNNPQYIDTTSSPTFVNSIPNDFQKINIAGNATSGTDVTLGVKVGDGDTARGRNGIALLGNDDYSIGLTIEDESNIITKFYGTTIRTFSENITWNAPVTGHEFIGSTIDGSAQFNAESGVKIRNSTFQNYTGIEGSVVWNSGFNIKNSSFVANTNALGSGAAIEHEFSGAFIYDNLQFSDNDFDINFSLSTSGDLIIQATNNANPGTATSGNANSTVDIQNTVVLTLTDIIVGSEVRLFKSDPTGVFPVYLDGTESEDDGIFEYAYNFTGNFDADIVVVNTGYVYFRQNNNTLTSTPNTIKINQVFDRNYENPQ
ncbi:MAG: hypothetical protein ACXABD_04680 [Candidatus Thorarchaeota archaeon]|jgi:hypothetical protein